MNTNFEKTARTENYSSPTFDVATVNVEKGFCSSVDGSDHAGFMPGDDLNFDWE